MPHQRRQILPQLWPVFVLSQVFGVLPITLKSSNPQINKILLIYCIILNIIYHTIDCIAIFLVAVLNLSKPNVGPYEILSILTTFLSKTVLILNTYHTVLNSRKVLFILQEIVSLNKTLTIFHSTLIKIEIGLEIFCVIFVSGFLNAYFSGIYLVDNASFIEVFAFVSVSFCINLIQLQFYMICCILRYLFKSINRELWEYNNNIINKLDNNSTMTEDRLHELRKSYRTLCNLINLINEMYGAHTIINLTSMNVFLQTNIDDLLIYVYNVIFDIKHEAVGIGTYAILWILYEVSEISFYFLQGISLKNEVRVYLLLFLMYISCYYYFRAFSQELFYREKQIMRNDLNFKKQ